MAQKGEKHANAVLNEKLVQEMRRLYWTKGITANCCAKLFGVHPQTAHDAVTYRYWREVPDTFEGDEIVRK